MTCMRPFESAATRSRDLSRRLAPLACTGTTLLTLVVAGCNSMNMENGLLDAEPGALPDLHGKAQVQDIASSGEPSLRGLDRRHWDPVIIRVPGGQVEHQPTYFEPVLLASGPARNTGAAPTTDTVLEGASDGGSLAIETVAAPFIFGGELLILPIRAIIDPPWSVHRAPSTPRPSAAESAPVDWRWVEPQ
ncbi:MAG: hypothetical protein KF724_05100 [Phycisphaeraceae bacterium]|nr:hypothetical protein [Phycisphaeraceae bacterium]